jgi:hypothetical protein
MGGPQSRLAYLGKSEAYLQNNQVKRAGDVAQALECLPSKSKALNSPIEMHCLCK